MPNQPSLSQELDALRAAVKGFPNGARALSEFLGENCMPVARELAQSRADVCKGCPHNSKGGVVASAVRIASHALRELKGLKSHLRLGVEGESKLGTCAVCLCWMPGKVWIPIETIKRNTDEETMKKFPEHCWVGKECRR